MIFKIQALPYDTFAPLFALTDTELTARGARRVVADTAPGFPCRVSLQDALPGTPLVLVNHTHLKANSPYAAKHAIFVSENAAQAAPAPGAVPQMLQTRLLSLRAFSDDAMMLDAEITEGTQSAQILEQMFADQTTSFVDIHFATRGCFAARAVRV